MYVDVVPNRNSPPAILLRESIREGRKIRKRTLANLSHWPPAQIEALRRVLRGDILVPPQDAMEIVSSRPHGHVAAVLGTLRRLGLEQMLGRKRDRYRALCVAMIVARVLHPCSKLATTRVWQQSTLPDELGIGPASVNELYAALDWLLARQPRIEAMLAKRHLQDATLVLYDVTSTYFEGRTCPLGRFGHNRDGKLGKLQIVFGLLCNAAGCPVAVEVFEGDVSDPATLRSQVEKLRSRFGLQRVVLVGDRGMITSARIREDLRPIPELEWITALRATAIQGLMKQGALQLSIFDQQDLAEICSPDYPGERLIVCKNPWLAQERARKRQELLAATEAELAKVAAATQRTKSPLRGKDQIGLRVGRVLHRYKMAKHFRLTITDESLSYERDAASIQREAALDGLYVIRTSVTTDKLSAAEAVAAYKRLAGVERAFRSLKTVDLDVRPIFHRLADRVRAHVFLCMLAYYVEWHMRRALAPLLFDDHERPARVGSPVAPAKRSAAAEAKARTQRLADGTPVHSFRTLLGELATLVRNRVQPKTSGALAFDMLTRPNPTQQRAFELLGVRTQ